MFLRNLGRLGVAAFVAAGAVGLTAAPALAARVAPAQVDLGIDVAGTTLTADFVGKFSTVDVHNFGTTKPAAVVVTFDASALDTSKVKLSGFDGCTTDKGVSTCAVADRDVPGPGQTTKYVVPLLAVAGATGSAGKLTVAVKVAGDAVAANDSRTVDVTISTAHGADLGVVANDVKWQDPNGAFTDDPIPPGKTSIFIPLILNQGDMTATGVRVTIKLPPHTSFTQRVYNGCVSGSGGRTLDCKLPQFPLTPRQNIGEIIDDGNGMFFSFEVLVAADAKGPVMLPGGAITVEALGEAPYEAAIAKRAAVPALPDYIKWATADQLRDVDASDNVDTFGVYAGGQATTSPSASASPSGQGGGQGGGDEDGGGLPVTGPAGIAIGGAGIAVLVVGVSLMVAARRRRVRIEI
ncbi:hypothetical protein [Paractinoplanes durhamensis]|uniref:Uncharacterized protein n=1 Tax=Paractinoplanes durhamensis TaxID=113563 RepID=A0ABQ3Z338_9ACTN|nr:hypothetical protein [Actinoplanes durhamensis]GIE04206.1 hypothetical protein Adu01nite_55560 [Actinoplanes durhamensis]